MLSPSGKCKTFDAEADGFARGEGCGSVVVKRLSQAQSDGDRILAVLASVAVNQDGRSAGLTAPNGPSQEAVIRSALAAAHLDPHDIVHLESHGTATKLGDSIEWTALSNVFGSRRGSSSPPLYVGSVKSNIGHLEGGAGIAGLIKSIMILHSRRIPPQANFKTMNPLFDGANSLVVPTEQTSLHNLGNAHRLACGISSFGFGGTNAHAIIRLPTIAEAGDNSKHSQTTCLWPFDRKYLSWRPSDSPLITSKEVREGGQRILYRAVLGERIRRNLLDGHKVRGNVVVPAAAILEMLRAAVEAAHRDDEEFAASLILDELILAKAIVLPDLGTGMLPVLYLQCSTAATFGRTDRLEWRVETESQGQVTLHAMATFRPVTGAGSGEALDIEDVNLMHSSMIEPTEFYQRLAARGLQYGPEFAVLSRIAINRGRSSVFVKIGRASAPLDQDGIHAGSGFTVNRAEYFVPPHLSDAAFQACSLLHQDTDAGTFMPFQLRDVRWHIVDRSDPARRPRYAVVRRLDGSDATTLVTTVDVFDQKGKPLLTVGRFIAKKLPSPGGQPHPQGDQLPNASRADEAGMQRGHVSEPVDSSHRGKLYRESLQPVANSRLSGQTDTAGPNINCFAMIRGASLQGSASRGLMSLPMQHLDLEPASNLHNRLSALSGIQGILFMPSISLDNPSVGCLEVLQIVKAVDNLSSPPPLYITDSLSSRTSSSTDFRVPENSWYLSGLVRACRVECPSLRIFLWHVDLALARQEDFFTSTRASQAISKLLPVEQEVFTDENGHYGELSSIS